MFEEQQELFKKMKNVEPSISAKDVSKEHEIPLSYVYKLAARGILPSYHVGKHLRFKRSEVDKALQRRQRSMKPIDMEIKLGGKMKGQKIKISLRGGICGEIEPLLADYDFFTALDMLLNANPDAYTDEQSPDKMTLVIGRKDDKGRLPDW